MRSVRDIAVHGLSLLGIWASLTLNSIARMRHSYIFRTGVVQHLRVLIGGEEV